MYLAYYMQGSVHGKDPTTSPYGHTCAKEVISVFSKNTIITKNFKKYHWCVRGWDNRRPYISNYLTKYIYHQKV